ncbi:hypothetical protein DRJ19_02560 [Candidatus Woesearchaeota archaeon]|nr:MAG: hypothetical protein DRJ19_02560 [Candidatus Woesearchaeota archaeon]
MKELLALIPENRRKFIAFLCENDAPHSLSQISHSLRLVHQTTRKIAYEFVALGFVKIYNIGRAKVVMRTEKLKEVCNDIRKNARV